MSFALAWLELREPADHAARDPALLARARAWLGADGLAVDLGAGSGSTLRAFGAAAPGPRWRLIDRDAGLLAVARARHGAEVAALDLRDIDALPLAGARLVTASALCDLVSRDWLERILDRLPDGAGFYAALSYDGAMAWDPEHPLDRAVTAAFNAHQAGDKGFGPALGPAAPGVLAAALRARGFRVWAAPSPWRLGPDRAALQDALVDGIAAAAGEAGFARAEVWRQARRAASGSGSATVGHGDVLALPTSASRQSKTTSVPSP